MRPSLPLLLPALLGGCASTPQPKPFAHQFTPAELSADVAVLRGAFEEGHAAMYRWRSKPTVDSIWKALEDSAKTPMTTLDFWRLTARALTGLRDGHIAVFPGQNVNPEIFRRTIPFTLFVDAAELRLYVRRNLSDAAGIADGSEIVRINGLTGPAFLAECLRYIPADADIRIRGLRRLTREFELTCAPAFGLPEQWSVVVRTPNGSSDSATVASIPWAEKRKRLRERAPADTTPRPIGELRFARGDSVAILVLGRWSKQDKFDPEKFIKQSFEQLATRRVCNLVIDLRGNTGGADKYAAQLYRQIARDTFTYYGGQRIINKKRYQFLRHTEDWPINWALPFYDKKKLPDGRYQLALDMDKSMRPEKNAYQGPVTLLLDGDSFSTSSEFGTVVRFFNRGTIVGEDTPTPEIGGSGASVGFKLANTQLDVGLPLAYVVMRTRAAAGPGVAPDVRVNRTIQQVLSGEDAALAAATRCP